MATEKTPTNPYGIDWSAFDKWSKNVNRCGCGQVFLSHTKLVRVNDGFVCVGRIPCPMCDRCDDIKRSSSTESERVILTKQDIQET